MASEINIPAGHVFVGARGGFSVPIQQSNGQPQDISGWAMECAIREGPEPTAALVVSVTTTSGSNGVVSRVTGPQGVVNVARVEFTPAALMPGGSPKDRGVYYWTLKRTDANNEFVIAYGAIDVTMSASR